MSLPCRDLVGVNPDFKRSLFGEFQQTSRSCSRSRKGLAEIKGIDNDLLLDDFALNVVRIAVQRPRRRKFFVIVLPPA